jgi:hypothetical protein
MATNAETREKLASVVGEKNLSDDPEILSGYSAAGVVTGPAPDLMVKPSSAWQVRDLVKLAGSEGINLVASSSGPPRMRGDTVPGGVAVVVDLSGMDRIIRVDRKNKVALIEPGVTFSEINRAADEAGLRVLMPLLPRKTKSVLASYLEREPIIIPKYHWDMTDPLLCTEMVFGTGDMFRTGSAAGPGSLDAGDIVA